MKTWYDRKARHRVFSSGDQVLVLLPVPGSVLQAQYSGLYIIERKVGECNYVVKTPDRKRKTRMCHVNLLKPYIDRNQTVCAEVKAFAVLNVPSMETEGSVAVSGVAQGRLSNSKVLADLDSHLSYVNPSECTDIIQLISQHLALFSDVPTCTNVLEHDIDVGQATPIKHPYRVNPVKRQLLHKEVQYMLNIQYMLSMMVLFVFVQIFAR